MACWEPSAQTTRVRDHHCAASAVSVLEKAAAAGCEVGGEGEEEEEEARPVDAREGSGGGGTSEKDGKVVWGSPVVDSATAITDEERKETRRADHVAAAAPDVPFVASASAEEGEEGGQLGWCSVVGCSAVRTLASHDTSCAGVGVCDTSEEVAASPAACLPVSTKHAGAGTHVVEPRESPSRPSSERLSVLSGATHPALCRGEGVVQVDTTVDTRRVLRLPGWSVPLKQTSS